MTEDQRPVPHESYVLVGDGFRHVCLGIGERARGIPVRPSQAPVLPGCVCKPNGHSFHVELGSI